MIESSGSLRTRIIVPVFVIVSVTAVSLFLIVFSASHNISKQNYAYLLEHHGADVRKLLDTSITELVAAQLTENPMVVGAKQEIAVEEVAELLKMHDLRGLIIRNDVHALFSSIDEAIIKGCSKLFERPGPFHFEIGLSHYNGYVLTFPAWNWRIVILHKPVNWMIEAHGHALIYLLAAVSLSWITLFASILLIFRKNFQQPVDAVLSDLGGGRNVGSTGISELDTIIDAVNVSFERLRTKTAQVEALHEIAVSLQDQSRDDTIDSILRKVDRMLGVEFSVLSLYDGKGAVIKTFMHGTPQLSRLFSQEAGLFDKLNVSEAPIRINDSSRHTLFSGVAHSLIQSLMFIPIFYDDGRARGALVFINKPGGFTDDDETLLKTVSADTAIALSKAERLMQLGRFKQVIDSSFDLIMMTDEEGLITYINPACERLAGYSVDELIGKKADIFMQSQDSGISTGAIWQTVRMGDVWRGEFANRKKNGEIYHTSAVICPLHGAEGMMFAFIQRDITQEKRLYEQLLRAQKLEAIGTLAGGIAHDFNNILTAILGYADLIVETTKEGEAVGRYAKTIFKAAEQGAELTRKILSITRKEKIQVRPVNINDIVRESLSLLHRSIYKEIEVVTNLDETLPNVAGDPSQLQQVIVNLAVNARDAMPAGGRLLISTELSDSDSVGVVHPAKGFVKLSISDTGLGMDEETRRKIFDPFFTTKETGKGTGLGLFIVHSIVAKHEGSINLYSEPGTGTRFSIYLPVSRGVVIEKKEEDEDILGTGTVLVIDDEPHVRELCRDFLEPLGYSVVQAAGGSQGVQTFREMHDRISIVILDLIMPKMGGAEVYHELKSIKPDVAVLLCSGYSPDGFSGIEELIREGVKGFISKPFSKKALAGALRKALGDQPSHQADSDQDRRPEIQGGSGIMQA